MSLWLVFVCLRLLLPTGPVSSKGGTSLKVLIPLKGREGPGPTRLIMMSMGKCLIMLSK